MEKLTIVRIGEIKTVQYTNKRTGKPDSFQKVGFQTREYPDRWFDLIFRGIPPITEGQSYEFELTSREYNGKTYWDAKLPNKEDMLRAEVESLKSRVLRLEEAIYKK